MSSTESAIASKQESIESLLTKLNNPVYSADSYKFSHFDQYVPGMISMFDYYENRGNGPAIFTGLSYYIARYFNDNLLTHEIVDMIEEDAASHGVSFNAEAFHTIVDEYGGKLPLRIRAVPENGLYPEGVPLFTVESTDTRFAWIAGIVETMLMKVWYPSAVATKAYNVKQVLKAYYEKTSMSPEVAILFGFHNFGARGSSSEESAIIGGVAHLPQFLGTDNFKAIRAARIIYGKGEGYSIDATEHSTTTSWGVISEWEFLVSYVRSRIAKGKKLFAAVCDSYNYFNLVERVIAEGSEVRVMLEEAGAKLILRPDSGDQLEILKWTANALKASGAFTKNDKGYYTSDTFGVIWGDGVNPTTIAQMCEQWVNEDEMSMDNLAFGSGGDLMQNVNRDTHKTAIKCSSVEFVENGEVFQRDVFKDPITDPGKKSKKGRVTTCWDEENSRFYVANMDDPRYNPKEDIMEVVYEVGPVGKVA